MTPDGRSLGRVLTLGAVLCSWAWTAGAAEPAQFYTLSDRWEKQNLSGKTRKEALDDGFRSALYTNEAGNVLNTPPPPETLRRTFPQIASSGNAIEIEDGQTLLVSSPSPITKFVTTQEGVVTLESPKPDALSVTGTGLGRTFVHAWNAEGRHTFEVSVRIRRYAPTASQRRRTEEIERNRSFKVQYSNNRSAYYTGAKYSERERASFDFTQNFAFDGDTPYGYLTGKAETQRDGKKTIINDMQLALHDGKIGPFSRFDAVVGDADVEPALLVFPRARVRGASIEHWDAEPTRVRWSGFYGREQTSIIGTLTPGILSKRTTDSFLGGGTVDFKMRDDVRLKGGYFTGSGRTRPDELNRRGAAGLAEIDFGPHLRYVPELGFDDERFAHFNTLRLNTERFQARGQVRDISRNFRTLVGSPSQQGEQGYLASFSAQPIDQLTLEGSIDVFEDRLIPNPEMPGARNIHTDLRASFIPDDRSVLSVNYQDLDDTGRLAPARQRSFHTQYNRVIDLLGRRATLTVRHLFRENENLTNSILNYDNHQASLGLYLPLFWGINFSIQREWNWLEEPVAGLESEPGALTYSLDWSRQLWDSPFFLDLRLRIRDEEETESANSFMTGEDSTEISAGLYYREYQDMEIYLTGSFENFVPESLNVTEPRIEAQLITGMRYLYDTGFRWEGSGSFEGFVYKDQNDDGQRQEDEPGLEGMKIEASDGKTVVTDSHGYYKLPSVRGKRATLRLDSANFPFGYVPTSSTERLVDVLSGKTSRVDFGLAPRSELVGVVYNDLNGNGRYDLTDVGVRRVRISLENGQVARTNNIGVYSFPDLVAGEHAARLDLATLPLGYLPVDVKPKPFKLSEGIRYELHFPLKAVRNVTGRVFLDVDGDGQMTAADRPLGGAKVILGPRQLVTDADGRYLFDSVDSGVYEFALDPETLPEGGKLDRKVTVDFPVEPTTITDLHLPVVVPAPAAETPPAGQPASEEPSA